MFINRTAAACTTDAVAAGEKEGEDEGDERDELGEYPVVGGGEGEGVVVVVAPMAGEFVKVGKQTISLYRIAEL